MLPLLPFAFLFAAWNGVRATESSAARSLPPVHRLLRRTDNATSTQATIVPVAISDDKQSYYAVLSAGDIFFRVALDTASADLWITSSQCDTKTCRDLPRYPLFYNSPSFATVNDNATAFNVSFVDGSAASGFTARESIAMANLTIPNQAFGVVTQSNVSFASDVSGILGLGFPRLSTIANSAVNATPFFANLAQQGLLDYPIFSVSLTLNTSGSIAFGAVDANVVKNASAIVWNEVPAFSPFGNERNQSGYLQWAVSLDGIAVNGSGIVPKPTYPNGSYAQSLALLDIGTPGIFGPWQDVQRIFAKIENARLVDQSGQWVVPCNIQESMAFTIAGHNFTLAPTDYLIGPASGNPDLCLSWPRASSPSPDGIDWQLGAAFLRTVYSIFSLGIDGKEPPMIGLYPLHNDTILSAQNLAAASTTITAVQSTVPTTLPNSLLDTPTLTTPAYIFNTSVHASLGEIVTSDLATSTYRPLLLATPVNTSAIPNVTLSRTLQTFTSTDTAGHTLTSVSVAPTVTLGQIPGRAFSGAAAAHAVQHRTMLLSSLLLSVMDLYMAF